MSRRYPPRCANFPPAIRAKCRTSCSFLVTAAPSTGWKSSPFPNPKPTRCCSPVLACSDSQHVAGNSKLLSPAQHHLYRPRFGGVSFWGFTARYFPMQRATRLHLVNEISTKRRFRGVIADRQYYRNTSSLQRRARADNSITHA